MTAPIAKATIIDKLMLIPHLIGIFIAVLVRISQYMTSKEIVKDHFKDLVCAALRRNLGSINKAQEQWLVTTSTQDVYLDFTQKQKLQAESTQLNSGLRLHWLGPKTSEKVILFFHGGAYTFPTTEGHLKWLFNLQQDLSKTRSTSVLLVGYTLTPHATYPLQLQQAAEALNWLIGKRGTKANDIILMGDSAGGNLALGLLSHLIHPHSNVIRIDLTEPLASAVLISPWVTFSTKDDSFTRNKRRDLIPAVAVERWASLFLDGQQSDEYSEPVKADADWYKGLDRVVADVLLWGGSREVFVDSIQSVGGTMKEAHAGVEVVVQDGAIHDDFITDTILGYEGKHQGTELIESWIKERI